MQTLSRTRISHLARILAAVAATAATAATVGCGAGLSTSPAVVTTNVAMQGHVFGGQQPVSGATIQLYAANQTGYGTPATALISGAVTTTASGGFALSGAYTCPYPTSQVYLTATGGNSGSGTNANLVLMAPLGTCSNLASMSYVVINELTTVAGAYALSPFMSSPTQLSVSPTNVTGLSNAFATVNKLVNLSAGTLPGSTLPAGAAEPTSLMNTVADILASCINSNGVGGSSNNCATLFADTTLPGGTMPTDTLTAALNLAKNPANDAGALYTLATPSAPFQPTLTSAPTAYTVSITYAPTGTFSAPSASALDAAGNLWVANSGNNTIAVLNAATGTPTTYSSGGLNAPSGIAFDASGNAWVPNKGNSTLSVFTPAGVGSVALTANLSSPTAVAIDAQGLIWVTDSGNNSVTSVTPSGLSVTASTPYAIGGTNPVAVAINPH